MATPTSPYVNAAAVQTAVLPPPAAQPQQSVAARRSFKSFVEAMDDFSGDRRDVAGMRQVLAMQEDNNRALAAQQEFQKQQQAASNARSFAPDQGQPDVPVVRGPAQPAAVQQSVLPSPYASATGNAMPRLPGASETAPIGAVPRLPVAAQPLESANAGPSVVNTAGGPVPTLVIDPSKINPAAGPVPGSKIVAFMPMNASAATAPAAAVSPDATLPAQLQSPLVDEVRNATRTGARPGLSDEAMARFSATADRKRSLTPPMPPKLMAQEARWNRDAWPATVAGGASGAARPMTTATDMAAASEPASVLPRLPGAVAAN